MNGNKPDVSIIIPCYNEEEYISSCLDSVLSQDYPKDKMEVLVIDGNSIDQTSRIIKDYCSKYSFIHYLFNVQRNVPISMNLAIAQAKGDYIIRLDAHSSYPKDYFSKLIEAAIKNTTDNVGGICNTDVKNKTSRSLAIKEVLSHRFGVGNSLFRTGTKEPVEADTVPFGCFRKDVFERFGKYDERLVRNQDIELNKRIKKGGGKIMLIPEIQCTYYARETFSGLMKNNFQNGLWNILTVYYTDRMSSLSMRHFIPLLFVLSIITPVLFSLIWVPFLWISAFCFILYFSCVLLVSITLSVQKKLNIFYTVYAFTLLHLSYGCGSLMGLFHSHK
jgi:glycosyltransferase involved in cell wall biosynthesis